MDHQNGADQPLLANENSDHSDELLEIRDVPLKGHDGLYVWALTLTAGISGLLFGYDTGVISATLVSIKTDLSGKLLTTIDKSIITACTSLFALIASPLAGVAADAFGRRRVLLVADVLFTVGALCQAFTSSVFGMVVGRSLVGLAVGSASMVSSLYISELAPSHLRGRLVTIFALFITGGQVIAYIIGWLFSTLSGGWRWIVGLGAAPAIVQLILLGFLPESPRWLVYVGRTAEARAVLVKIFGSDSHATHKAAAVLRAIEGDVVDEAAQLNYNKTESSFRRALHTVHELWRVASNRRALIIAVVLQAFQQLCGFNSLMYFSATIFQSLSFSSPTLTSLTVAGTNFLFTLLAFSLIDRAGRRRILLYSIPFMVVALLVCAAAFSQMRWSHSLSFLDDDTPRQSSQTSSMPVVILACLTVYTAAYASGLGNVPWQQSELFSLSVRSLGSALATATNWGSNFIVGLTFLPMMEMLTPRWTFIIYACVCFIGWVILWFIYPEMSGMSLEEVKELLNDGWGVSESVRNHRSRVM